MKARRPLAEALGYVRNQWQALNLYLTDGDLSIDNNTALRCLAISRWLGINPWLYLKDVLVRIRTCPAEQPPTLLPDAWAKSQAESIAADKSN